MSRSTLASAIRLEGALFSRDFLARLGAPLTDLTYVTPLSYGIDPNRKLREEISTSWNALSARWARFKTERDKLPADDHLVALTRREWLLPVLHELGFGRVQPATAIRITVGEDTKEYAISHGWDRTLLHLLGARVPLDIRTANVPGAALMAPHALVQECLNRSGEHLWAVVTNGYKWRLLRDSAAIARKSYVEFDLEAIFEGENTADFALFWLLCHASRFEWRQAAPPAAEEDAEPATATTAEPPILEAWLNATHAEGTRALDKLRDGVQAAIEKLATGFLAHPANTALRGQLRERQLEKLDYYKLVLRVVYRMLFLMVAEAKEALLLENTDAEARRRYEEYYSLARLRLRAAKTRGTHHPDGWQALTLTFGFFREGEPGLAVPALGGFLFEPVLLDQCQLTNEHLFGALRALCFFQDGTTRRPVNFNLGSEELGSVYESLLELSPVLDVDARRFEFQTLSGNERKTTGSYYTPEILVKSLLDSALEPVLDRAAQQGEQAILNLKLCDPACGSGHFLTAAARRIAERLALLRTGGDEPSPAQRRHALREVVGKCIYGIDINPMAIELCKVALWMEGLEPGRPLSFLNSHIRPGNALLGATPAMVEGGLPDEAFAVLEGDDKSAVSALKKRNRQERESQSSLFADETLPLGDLGGAIRALEAVDDATLEGVVTKARMLHSLESSGSYDHTHLLYDAWCAAFVWKKVPEQVRAEGNFAPSRDNSDFIQPLTTEGIRYIQRSARPMFHEQRAEITRLREQYKWFHPHLEFSAVFAEGGFDVILGNPPWERVKLQEKEWFAARHPAIAMAPNAAARSRLIEALKADDPPLHRAFTDDRRRAEGESHFARASCRFPLCGRGDVNTYALFAELNRNLINGTGRVGCIVPSGIATDDTTKFFFQSLTENDSLVSLFDFENREAIFPGVHRSFKFCLLTMSGLQARMPQATFVFFATRAEHLEDPQRRFTLNGEDIALLNPNTRTCPIFRTGRDAEINKAIYRRVPVLADEGNSDEGNPWKVSYLRMFDMANDSPLFKTRENLVLGGGDISGNIFHIGQSAYLPVFEGKTVEIYNHRHASIQFNDQNVQRQANPETSALHELCDPAFSIQPHYWIKKDEVDDRWPNGQHAWAVAFKRKTTAIAARTLKLAVIPYVACSDTLPIIHLDVHPRNVACFIAICNSFIVDFLTRQKCGYFNLAFFAVNQLPILSPDTLSSASLWKQETELRDWIALRVLELTYTAYDLRDWAHDLGYDGEPFPWDVERRFQLRCELDAAFFHLYGLTRDETAYVMDTFPIVRRKDEAAHGTYRTKDTILRLYDEMGGGSFDSEERTGS